jgi:hypothetical protein
MDVGWMHWAYFAWLVYKQKSEDCIVDVCNWVKQLQPDCDLDKSKEASGVDPVACISPRKRWGVRPMAWISPK